VKPSFKLSWEPLIFQQNIYRRKIPQQCYRNWPNLCLLVISIIVFLNYMLLFVFLLLHMHASESIIKEKKGNFLLAWAGQFAGIKYQTMHHPISLWHKWHILSSLGIFTHLPVSTGIFKLQHLHLVIKALLFGDNLSK
jgi:hypothetical protein